MKKDRYIYKEQAAENMKGKYSVVIPIILIFGIIQSLMSGITESFRPQYEIDWETYTRTLVDSGNSGLAFLFSVISFIIAAIIIYSTTKMFIQTAKDEKPVIEEILLVGVKEKPSRSVILHFLVSLFVFLWALLLIIPGIIKAYAYSMSFYLLIQEPELNSSEAIEKSKDLTRGYKMDLFLLDLSYLGWYILGLFTLGILWLWIIPKHGTAKILYFDEIYGKQEDKIINDENEAFIGMK